jgi:hypothetical protein
VSAWQKFWAAGRVPNNDSSNVFFGPQLRLPGGDSGAIEFDQAGLPSVYQFRGLTRAPLSTGKHSLHMDALPCRFIWCASRRVTGHQIRIRLYQTALANSLDQIGPPS